MRTYTNVAVQQGVDVEQCGHAHRTGDDAAACPWTPDTPIADLRDHRDFWAVVEPQRIPWHRDPPTGCIVVIKSCYNLCSHGVSTDEECRYCIIAEYGEAP